MNEENVATRIIGAAIEVHRELGGPGLLESIYGEALYCELQKQGLFVEKEKKVEVQYKNIPLRNHLFVDLLVEKSVIVEVKSVEKLAYIHHAQLLTYLRLSENHLGLLINFGEPLLKSGIKRIING